MRISKENTRNNINTDLDFFNNSKQNIETSIKSMENNIELMEKKDDDGLLSIIDNMKLELEKQQKSLDSIKATIIKKTTQLVELDSNLFNAALDIVLNNNVKVNKDATFNIDEVVNDKVVYYDIESNLLTITKPAYTSNKFKYVLIVIDGKTYKINGISLFYKLLMNFGNDDVSGCKTYLNKLRETLPEFKASHFALQRYNETQLIEISNTYGIHNYFIYFQNGKNTTKKSVKFTTQQVVNNVLSVELLQKELSIANIVEVTNSNYLQYIELFKEYTDFNKLELHEAKEQTEEQKLTK